MQFLNPIWLWGLTGLLIPIGIHLLSRKEGRTIKIGSIRHLEDSTTKQFKNLRLNEVLLLAIRCLLILLLVLLLSDFAFNSINENKKWLLIENGIEREEKFGTLIDSLQQNGFEVRSLTDGFPDLNDSLDNEGKIDYWSLMRELRINEVDHAVVLSHNYIKKFRGKRVAIPENVRWISKSPAPKKFLLNTILLTQDSIAQRIGETDANRTRFREVVSATIDPLSTHGLSSVSIQQRDTISISIAYDSSFVYDKDIINAAVHAIDKEILSVLTLNEYLTSEFPSTNKTDWTVWLSDKPVSGLSENVIRYQRTLTNDGLLKRDVNSTSTNSWILTARLDEGTALRENLSVQLALILTGKEGEKRKVFNFDRRVLSDLLMWSKKKSDTTSYKATISTASDEKIISIIFVIVLLLERWIAFKRNQ